MAFEDIVFANDVSASDSVAALAVHYKRDFVMDCDPFTEHKHKSREPVPTPLRSPNMISRLDLTFRP